MKKLTLNTLFTIIALLCLNFNSNAQTTVTVNTGATWNGYVNCFDLSNNYQWGSGWALADLKSTVSATSVTLQPNFNTYNATDPYWSNGAIGNKNLELNTFLESTTLINQTVTFTGNVSSNTLSAGYTQEAFIKALDPANGYATVVNQLVPLPTSGTFSVSAAIPNTAGLIVQYGFRIYGLNANPTAEAALGSVVVGPTFPLSLQLEKFNAKMVNNAVSINWTTSNEENVKEFEIQKSTDAKTFVAIALVNANNQLSNEYEVLDNNCNQTSYYRLKMIDNDGKYTYSQIEKIEKANSNEISLYPNPATNSISIIANNQTATVYSIFGNAVKQLNVNEGLTNIDISSLNTGNYIIQFSKGQVVNFTKK